MSNLVIEFSDCWFVPLVTFPYWTLLGFCGKDQYILGQVCAATELHVLGSNLHTPIHAAVAEHTLNIRVREA